MADQAATQRGLVLIDSRDIDIEMLMAENERLLSTLDTALSLTQEPIKSAPSGGRETVASVASLPEDTAPDVRVLSRELELNRTRTDLLNAELEIERETIEKLAEELAVSRQETRALEREAMRLNDNLEQRDGRIAGLKGEIISLQTGQTDTDVARRRAVQLLNEQNAVLTAEINDVRNQIDQRSLQLKSLEGRLAQSEADTTRLNSLLVQREEQIASLTDAQNLILDRLETKVQDQMASVEAAIEFAAGAGAGLVGGGLHAQIFGEHTSAWFWLVIFILVCSVFGLNLKGKISTGKTVLLCMVFMALGGGLTALGGGLMQWGWAVFHILVITLQAFIFMVLTVVYLSMAHEDH